MNVPEIIFALNMLSALTESVAMTAFVFLVDIRLTFLKSNLTKINLKGYYGNGYDCQRTEVIQTTPRTQPQPIAPCRDCSENAQCLEG